MKVAIAGFGREGQANFAYWSKLGADITIVDEGSPADLPENVTTILGAGAFDKLDDFDMVVRTAGVSPYKLKTNGKIWSGTNEFFAKCQNTIIGVTGTKGKGTTSSMMASILEAAGKKVWLVGNIGIPSLSVLEKIQPDDVVVYELSSFQLWDLEKSPQVAVVLGIEPEHLDVHRDFDDYVNAKGNIRRHQTGDDFCVFYNDNQYSRQIAELSTAASQSYALDSGSGTHVEGGLFVIDDDVICSTDEVKLPGQHNIENACAAVAVAHHLGVSNDDIATGLRNFNGLPHRLEYVTTIQGAKFYNDSFSSSTPAVLAAAKSFSDNEIIIVGGVDRGGDFEHLASEMSQLKNIKEIIFIGQARQKLYDIFTKANLEAILTISDAETMREIVEQAFERSQPDDVVLLSPGCASFDMFQDFYDRGDQFRREVQAIKHRDDTFVFDNYAYDKVTGVASFNYHFKDSGYNFTETVRYEPTSDYNVDVLDRALRLAFLLIGTSYYKTFPVKDVSLPWPIDDFQADFLNHVYQEGLSQFAYENNLTRQDLASFRSADDDIKSAVGYDGSGILSLQSGGKDSLLTASLLNERGDNFVGWYISSSDSHPHILDDLGRPLLVSRRQVDLVKLNELHEIGARNGHVPITYIVQSFALIQAILTNRDTVLVSIAHEGEEPHAEIGDMSVTHQWSKTWQAEQDYAKYVKRYISGDIKIGSPLRQYSELRVAELFVQKAWDKFGYKFSSCNRANYRQAADNSELHWCGNCPKCANTYILFAPFLPADELKSLFGGQDLFTKPSLEETFKGLLGLYGVIKPFECVGEANELRYAYLLAQEKGGYGRLPFEVPATDYDYLVEWPHQNNLITLV